MESGQAERRIGVPYGLVYGTSVVVARFIGRWWACGAAINRRTTGFGAFNCVSPDTWQLQNLPDCMLVSREIAISIVI